MTAKAPRELDAIADTVLAYRPPETATASRPEPTAWSVPVEDILSNAGLRLDAAHFDAAASGALDFDTSPLSDWAEVRFVRDRGKKVFTTSPTGGAKPYLNATELQAQLSFAKEPIRFISRYSPLDFDAFLIEEGWLLVTRSGTLGRVFYVTKHFDGRFASDDLIRVIPKRPETAGYLYAWLSQPLARQQILREGYGGQIDHIDDTHLRTVPVPMLDEDTVLRIAEKVSSGMKRRDSALRNIEGAWDAD